MTSAQVWVPEFSSSAEMALAETSVAATAERKSSRRMAQTWVPLSPAAVAVPQRGASHSSASTPKIAP